MNRTLFAVSLFLLLLAAVPAALSQPGGVPSLSEAVMKAANANFDKGDYDAAIAGYTRYIELRPDSSAGWFNRGLARFNRSLKSPTEQGYRAAAADVSEAIKLDPKEAEYWFVRGGIHAMLMAVDFVPSRDRAIADFTEAIRLDPKYAAAYRERGVVYERSTRMQEALADLNAAIRLDAKNAVAFYTRSKVHGFRKNFAAARSDAQTALKLFPDYEAARIYLDFINSEEAKTRQQAGTAAGTRTPAPQPRPSPSSATTRPNQPAQAASPTGTNAGGVNDLGDGYSKTEAAIKAKDFARAAAFATQTLQMIPQKAENQTVQDVMDEIRISLLQMRAFSNSHLGKFGDSDADYKAAALAAMDKMSWHMKAANERYGPKSASSAGAIIMAGLDSSRATVTCQKGFKGAIEWMDEVKRTRPSDTAAAIQASIATIGVREICASAYSMHGRQQSASAALPSSDKMKKWSEAIESYTEAIKFTPREARLYADRATVYRRMGRNDLAAADEQKARELAPKN